MSNLNNNLSQNDIPDTWSRIPLYEFRNKNDRYGFTGGPFGSDLKSEHYTQSGVKILQLQNIGEGKFIDKGIVYTSEKKANELISCNIYPEEIILAKMAPVARCCKVPSTDERYVMCSDGIRLSVDTNKYDNNFVFQALNSKYFRDEAESKSTGTTRARIGLNELKQICLVVPNSLPEQQKIAEILSTVDDKIEVIDQQIIETQALKKGLMQRLLTKGIGHTEFKDSPLGVIPQSWEVVKLEEVCLPKEGMRRGPFGGAIKKEYFVDKGYQVYEQRNAIYDDFTTARYFINEEKYEELKAFKVVAYDFIISCSGTIGKIAKVPNDFKEGVINQALLRLRLKSNTIDDDFFLQQFRFEPFQNKITDSTQGGAMKNLVGMSEFRKSLIVLPKIKEQKTIAQILTLVDNKLDVLSEKKNHYQELKQGLMQQLLTGKIRVNI